MHLGPEKVPVRDDMVTEACPKQRLINAGRMRIC
jgi:hypothetical protein